MFTIRIAARSSRRQAGRTLKTSGLVLAGGKSSRFGRDKSLALIESRPLIDFVIDALDHVSDEVTIVGGSPAHALNREVAHIVDREEHAGPWIAMMSAADQVSGDVLVFLPCDLPLLSASSLERLKAEALLSGVAVAACDQQRHWSVSAWRRERFNKAVDLARDSGARSLHAAIEPVQPSFVAVEGREMLNVNTIDDLAEAQRYLAHLKHG